MNSTLNYTNYDMYVEIYNNQGREAAKDYVTNKCKMDLAVFQRKMRNETSYVFNRSTKKFEEQSADAQFMSLEDLCKTKSVPVNVKPVSSPIPSSGGFDELVVDLMRDKLIELHRFIRLDQYSKQLVVNSKLIKDCGYFLTII